jgi:tRNA (uracil-5-)-methyltransferase TRM9
MKDEVIQKLLDINDRFYQSFGAAFAETRRRIQPGVQRIVETYIHKGDWLDIGCGSGVLGQRLANGGMQGSYTGLDFSEPLLLEAQKGLNSLEPHCGFDLYYVRSNLLDQDWMTPVKTRSYDGILAFAVLHHLPGADKRWQVIHQAATLLKPGGLFIHSEWQFQNSAKLTARIQPWTLVGLTDEDVERGDALLDWRHQVEGQSHETGLRYVHLFHREELAELAQSSGFTIQEEFESDGAGGNLGLYQIWQKTA